MTTTTRIPNPLALGFSMLDPCDLCGTSGLTAWINGRVGVYDLGDDPTVAVPGEHLGPPERLAELHLYLCRTCLLEAVSRTDPPAR